MKGILVDSSLLVRIIIYKDEYLYRKLSKYRVFVPVNAIEEACYRIIISIIGEKLNTEKFYEIKEAWEKGIEAEEIEKRLTVFSDVLSNFIILPINDEIILDSFTIQIKYKLLPNDALIAASCKYYGIFKIATFDKDFERIDFLEMVKIS